MSRTSFSFALFGNTFQSEKSTNIKEVIDNITTLGGDIYIEKDSSRPDDAYGKFKDQIIEF